MWALRLISFACLLAVTQAKGVAAMQAGVAAVDITPKEPVWLAGFAARTKPSQGVRQRIFVKALALRDPGGATAVLVTADLLGFTGEFNARVARRVETLYQLQRKMLILNASHTHSAPVIGKALEPTYPLTGADRDAIRRYTARLEEQVVAVIGKAIADLAPADLSFGQGLAGLAVNRRRAGNPEFPNVTDPDLPVLTVRHPDGRVKAVVFGYACHNTTLDDDLVSGDWAGYAQEAVEGQFPGATAMFVQGCGADANPLPRHAEELARGYGRSIAVAVGEVVAAKRRPVEGGIVAGWKAIDLLLEAPPSRADLEKRSGQGSVMERQWARLMLGRLADGTMPASHSWEAQALRIGNSFTFLALGGEVVADYAVRFKRDYGYRNLWVAGYSNDVFAYIPSLRVWKEGGYEGGGAMVPYGLPSRFQSNVEELVVDAVDAVMASIGLPKAAASK